MYTCIHRRLIARVARLHVSLGYSFFDDRSWKQRVLGNSVSSTLSHSMRHSDCGRRSLLFRYARATVDQQCGYYCFTYIWQIDAISMLLCTGCPSTTERTRDRYCPWWQSVSSCVQGFHYPGKKLHALARGIVLQGNWGIVLRWFTMDIILYLFNCKFKNTFLWTVKD